LETHGGEHESGEYDVHSKSREKDTETFSVSG